MTEDRHQQRRRVPTYCYQCVAGPDFLLVDVDRGVATGIEPHHAMAELHPGCGKVCVKAYGLIEKTYNPNRVLSPMKRTNPRKGRDEDPGFVAISWDEALDLVAGRIRDTLAKGPLDESGYPRIAASFGGGGTPAYYMGTLPALLAALGKVDMSFGSGQGVKCYHSEHLYGELWHRAFTIAVDSPLCDYVLSFGSNVEASGGVCSVRRQADARARGARRVQIEPHLSVTGATSSRWIPIRVKTDAAFLYAMIHVLLNEHHERLDLPFLSRMTGAPYLVGPRGFFLREEASGKPLIFDRRTERPVVFDAPNADPALTGCFVASGTESGADGESWRHADVRVRPAHQLLIDHVATCTPEWAEGVCDVPAGTIREVADDYVRHARVGATIEIDGRTLPLRPVAIVLGKSVNNGWGGYDCCWARTVLSCLVGALEVPGSILGSTVRLNRPADDRHASLRPGDDGFPYYPFNPTGRDEWTARPDTRAAGRTLVPLVANSSWSQALAPTHLAWMQQHESMPNWPAATVPDIWFVYRTNPSISFWQTRRVEDAMARFPFTVCYAYTQDETNHMADVLLPDATDLESLQLIRIGGTKFVEQFWRHRGYALRQPVKAPAGEARDHTWIATELARRAGLLAAYNDAINRGAAGMPLKGDGYDFSLAPDEVCSVEEVWDRCCRAASADLTGGAERNGLDYYRRHGFRVAPFPQLRWYLYPAMEDQGLRFELPYQERLRRVGMQLGRRLREHGIDWWQRQTDEYEAMPSWKDYPRLWEEALAQGCGVDIADYPFWLVTSRSMQFAWGANADLPFAYEMAANVEGHGGVVINAGAARRLGLGDGDRVDIVSPVGSTAARIITRQGIRPDVLLMIGQFDHWKTPFARERRFPSMNGLVPMLLQLTDGTGSAADIVKVRIVRRERARKRS